VGKHPINGAKISLISSKSVNCENKLICN